MEDSEAHSRVERLRRAIEHSRIASDEAREALVQARTGLIEDFGDWMCGAGRLPSHGEIDQLDALTLAAEHAHRDYVRCMSELAGLLQASCVSTHRGAANAGLSAHP